jgi:hypothetical protein
VIGTRILTSGTLKGLRGRSMSAPYDPVRLPPEPSPIATLRPLASLTTGLPRLPEPPVRRAVPTTPADHVGARVDCFPTHAAFPKWPEGRHPHCHFRGMLGLHSRTARLMAQPPCGGLCRQAPALPVTRPSRSPATRAIDNYPGGFFLYRWFAPSGRTARRRHHAVMWIGEAQTPGAET